MHRNMLSLCRAVSREVPKHRYGWWLTGEGRYLEQRVGWVPEAIEPVRGPMVPAPVDGNPLSVAKGIEDRRESECVQVLMEADWIRLDSVLGPEGQCLVQRSPGHQPWRESCVATCGGHQGGQFVVF